MATIGDDPNGRRRILFVAEDGSRKTVRLGKCDRKAAESVCRHVEALLGAKLSGQPIPRDTAAWLPTVGSALKAKLAAVGLVEAERKLSVGEFVDHWIGEKRKAGHAIASVVAWSQSASEMKTLFAVRPLVSLKHADGEKYRTAIHARGLRPTTVAKRLGHARQMLEDAVRWGHVDANPWKHVRQRQGDPSERRAYVPVADIERAIEHAPNVWWKLFLALSRFGGLRIPSEAFSITWGDVDWERGRLTIPSPKTKNVGKSHRVIPLFPMLRPYLELAFDHAEEGQVFVVPEMYRKRAMGPNGWANANLRTTLEKIIRKAGIDPWPRLWHSLRASCESDLAQSFPLATVTKWLGNTPSVALRHYVDPTESSFDTALTWNPPRKSGTESGTVAAQNQAQQAAAGNGGESQRWPESQEPQGVLQPLAVPSELVHNRSLEAAGIEPVAFSPWNQPLSGEGGTESGTVTHADPDLAKLVEGWPRLPEALRAGIMAMVKAAGG